MEARRPEARAGTGPRRAEEEERRRQLREYLAAKGRLRQRPGGGGGGGESSFKDRTSRQDRAPSRPDPATRGQQNGGPATSRQAQTAKDEGGQHPLGRPSRAKAALRPKAAPSRLPGGRERPGQRPLGQATKTARREAAPGMASRAGWRHALNRQAKREGEKENRGVTQGPPPEKKRAAPRGSLRGPCQATAKAPGEKKSHQAAGNIPHGKGQARAGRLAEAQARGKPRGLPGSSQRAAPRASGARPSLRPQGGPTVSRPAVKSRGPDPRAAKPANSAPVQGERLPGGDPLAQRAVQGRPPRQQAKGCPAVLTERRPPRPPVALREMPPEGPLAACGSIRPKKSPGRNRPGEERRCRAPRTSGTRAADHQLAAAAGGATGRGRRSPPSRRPTPRRPPGPLTPSPQDRRKLLAEWLASRGKSYKRPPMTLPAKKRPEEKASLNLSFWRRMEEEKEEEEKEAQEQLTLASEISSTLAECLQLAEEGSFSEELLARLSHIPEVEKFAQFWICKARLLLAQGGPFDAAGLYEAAARTGAAPLQELWDAMADMLKDANKTPWAAPTPASLLPGKAQTESSPRGQNQGPVCKPISAVKFQVIPLFRVNERGARPEVKLLTPVRRSLRIERAAACYPQMLKDHHPVVSSLEEITATDCESQFIFRHNDALLEENLAAAAAAMMSVLGATPIDLPCAVPSTSGMTVSGFSGPGAGLVTTFPGFVQLLG